MLGDGTRSWGARELKELRYNSDRVACDPQAAGMVELTRGVRRGCDRSSACRCDAPMAQEIGQTADAIWTCWAITQTVELVQPSERRCRVSILDRCS